MKIIITSASGMVGKGVLLECLDHGRMGEALTIRRSTLDTHHPKLKQIIHKDFSGFSYIKDDLAGYVPAICVWV